MTAVLVDGNNVIGSVPDGWWRDRAGSVLRLVERLQSFAATGEPVEVVFDVPHPDLPEGEHDGVTIRYATRKGRDAADDRILELLDSRDDPGRYEVVTSDRTLAEGVRRRGASVTGARAFLARLDAAGC